MTNELKFNDFIKLILFNLQCFTWKKVLLGYNKILFKFLLSITRFQKPRTREFRQNKPGKIYKKCEKFCKNLEKTLNLYKNYLKTWNFKEFLHDKYQNYG